MVPFKDIRDFTSLSDPPWRVTVKTARRYRLTAQTARFYWQNDLPEAEMAMGKKE
jgi:hypothetical protein